MKWMLSITFGLAVVMPSCWGQVKRFPESCALCNETQRMGWGPVDYFSQHIVSYTLPSIPTAFIQAPPSEPWTFELTLGLDGKPCAIRLIGMNMDTFSEATAQAIRKWIFTPITRASGLVICYQSRVLVYIRKRSGKPVIEVPGITDIYQAPASK